MTSMGLFGDPPANLDIPNILNDLLSMPDMSQVKIAHLLNVSQPSITRWISGTAKPRANVERNITELYLRLKKDAADFENSKNKDYNSLFRSLREAFHKFGRFSNRNELVDELSKLLFAHISRILAGEEGLESLVQEGTYTAETLIDFVNNSFDTYFPEDMHKNLNREQFRLRILNSETELAKEIIRVFVLFAPKHLDPKNFVELEFLNDAFGRFLSDSFADEKQLGQYLTPPEVVKFSLEILTPYIKEAFLDGNMPTVLDPSCGVGSFLTAFFHLSIGLWSKESNVEEANLKANILAQDKIFGIDKSDRMMRLALVNFASFGMKATNMHLGNALSKEIEEEVFCSANEKFDFILTNPPFGAEYSKEEASWSRLHNFMSNDTKINSELLFLEKHINWLKDGGILLAIVPDSVLNNKGIYRNLREILKLEGELMAVISLPPVTFASAGTTTKTSLILLRRSKNPDRKPVSTFIAVANDVGYKVSTQSSIKKKTLTDRSDLLSIADAFISGESGEKWRWVENIMGNDRWDANYYLDFPSHIATVLKKYEGNLVSLGSLVNIVNQKRNPASLRGDEFLYVEISDIDPASNSVIPKVIKIDQAPGRARKLTQAGDILLSLVRPERKAIGILGIHNETVICSTGIAVLRSKGISPLILAKLLCNDIVTYQLLKHNIGVAYPVIDESCLYKIQLPISEDTLAYLNIIASKIYEEMLDIRNGIEFLESEIKKQFV